MKKQEGSMTRLIKHIAKFLVFTGLVIFTYTAIKQPIPDMQSLKLVVWGLLLFGLYIAITDVH